MSSPSKLPTGKFPGATNRYEDFVVVHMQQTLNIHGTVCKHGSQVGLFTNFDRETFSHGIGTIRGLMSKHYAMSAATTEPSPTGTGVDGRMTLKPPQSSMVRIPA